MWQWILGGGAMGLLGAVWALWERNKATSAKAGAQELQGNLFRLRQEHDALEADRDEIKRRTSSAEQFLSEEIKQADARSRPLHGDTLERLRGLLSPETPIATIEDGKLLIRPPGSKT